MSEQITVAQLVKRTEGFFARKGVPNPRLDAELIVAYGLHCRRIDLFVRFDHTVEESVLVGLREMVSRRGAREPLQYIIGSVDWAGLKLKVDRRALIPRPETEQLWELIVEHYKLSGRVPSQILDLGTGSGALALALKKTFPAAEVVAVDNSPDALDLARENATALKLAVDFRLGDWFSPIASDSKFDLIVSNPPYLTSNETDTAQPEVLAHEPRGALVSDDEGFADIACILTDARAHLSAGGELWLETGIAHLSRIKELGEGLAYCEVTGYKDYQHRDRFARLQTK